MLLIWYVGSFGKCLLFFAKEQMHAYIVLVTMATKFKNFEIQYLCM